MDFVLVFIVFITIMSITLLVAGHINTSLIQPFSDAGLNTSSLNDTTSALNVYNTGIPFIFFGFIIISVLLAWQLKASPIISIFLIMSMAVIGIVGEGMSNAFYAFSRDSALSSTADTFNYVVYLQDNLGYILIIAGIVILIFMFSKPKNFEVG